jgi:hypothetical protein
LLLLHLHLLLVLLLHPHLLLLNVRGHLRNLEKGKKEGKKKEKKSKCLISWQVMVDRTERKKNMCKHLPGEVKHRHEGMKSQVSND